MKIRIILRSENVCKVRNKSEQEHTQCVLVYVFRIMKTLCDAVTHYRTRDSADYVHYNRQKIRRISGEQHPRDMVDSHCKNGDKLN